ncbi:MAG: tetratricopeptide repeat protein, partial [Isosphaeraceae bacterium]
GHRFVVWEGGRLTVVGDWKTAHILRGRQHRLAGRESEAIADFEAAGQVPENLPSDEGGGDDHKAEIAYEMGLAYEAHGDRDKARKSWEAAAAENSSRGSRGRRWGFGGSAAERYFKALALRKLGQNNEAQAILKALVGSSEGRMAPANIDMSASVSDQEAQRDRLGNSRYSAGLGHLGLGEQDKARQELSKCMNICPDHLGAKSAIGSLAARR